MNSAFYLSKEESVQGSLLALRHIILHTHDEMEETKKYHMPCFAIRGKGVVHLWTDIKSGWPYILFIDGNKINHPLLYRGDRKRMKILLIDPNLDLPKEEIEEALKMAIEVAGINP